MFLYVIGLTPVVNFTHPFFNILSPKKLLCQTVTREKLRKALLYKKLSSKMLIKLTTDFVLKWKQGGEKEKNRDFPLSFVFILTQRRTRKEVKRQRRWQDENQKCAEDEFVLPNNQGSISPRITCSFCTKKIPKVQKDNDDLTVFCHFGILAH
jgi:hypothetical protein